MELSGLFVDVDKSCYRAALRKENYFLVQQYCKARDKFPKLLDLILTINLQYLVLDSGAVFQNIDRKNLQRSYHLKGFTPNHSLGRIVSLLGLKGQWHEIVDPFFYQNTRPCPPIEKALTVFYVFTEIFGKFTCLQSQHLRGHGVSLVNNYADSVSA